MKGLIRLFEGSHTATEATERIFTVDVIDPRHRMRLTRAAERSGWLVDVPNRVAQFTS